MTPGYTNNNNILQYSYQMIHELDTCIRHILIDIGHISQKKQNSEMIDDSALTWEMETCKNLPKNLTLWLINYAFSYAKNRWKSDWLDKKCNTLKEKKFYPAK